MTTPRETNARRTLLRRRNALLGMIAAGDEAARALHEDREIDWEDNAAHLVAASELEHVGESERAQLVRIEAALQRLDEGRWGHCVGCGGAIAPKRLAVMPEATLCISCSQRREARP
jgi:DnaK suppressor protein